MGLVSFEVARIVAPLLYIYNVAAQAYGIVLATPSITDIHDDNLSYFSPEPLFIGLAFTTVMATQGVWLWKFVRRNPNAPNDTTLETDILPYIPINLLSNFCIGTWVVFWTSSHLVIADLFVLVSTTAHLAYLFLSPSLSPRSQRASPPDHLTHAVVATFTALGVLDLLHNTSIAFATDEAPSLLVIILTGVGFVALSVIGDVIFGACLVYDLLALSAGQARYSDGGYGWSALLALYALVCAGIVGARKWVWPKYASQNGGVRYGRVISQDGGADI